jgi:hypothetical protein
LATIEYLPLSINAAPEMVYLGAFGGEQQFELTISNVPNHVAVGQLELQYDLPLTDGVIAGNNGTNGSFVGWERVCLLDASPTGLQSVPWVDFLEFSCRWAFGSVGQAQTMRELTKGLNKSNRCPDNRTLYSHAISSSYYLGSNLNYVDLSDFTVDLEEGPVISMDCRDYAGILYLAFQSQGANPTFRWLERWDPIQQFVPGGFYTWPLCPAGTDDTVSGDRQADLGNYNSLDFAFHCVIGANGERYDAAASYLWYYSSQIWEKPAFEWPEPLHWQNPIDSQFFGLAFGLIPGVHPFTYGQYLSWHYKDGKAPQFIS